VGIFLEFLVFRFLFLFAFVSRLSFSSRCVVWLGLIKEVDCKKLSVASCAVYEHNCTNQLTERKSGSTDGREKCCGIEPLW